MHVARQARAGNLPQVQPDVEPFGTDRSLQQADHLGDRLHQVELLGGFEVVQACHVAFGGDQQMAIVIRVAIQHRQRIPAMLHDQPPAIVVAGRRLAEEAVGDRGRAKTCRYSLLSAPLSPEMYASRQGAQSCS